MKINGSGIIGENSNGGESENGGCRIMAARQHRNWHRREMARNEERNERRQCGVASATTSVKSMK
jgi:hypothetical protein